MISLWEISFKPNSYHLETRALQQISCSCSQEKIGSLWDHGLLRDVKLRDVLQEEELSTREAAGITIR